MDEIKASPIVNPRMAAFAKLLRAGRDIGNKATFSPSIPLVGGRGMGDLVLGKVPEEVENWGYGNMPVRMPEMSNVPMVKTGRKEGLADAAGMLPFAGGDSMQAMAQIIRKSRKNPSWYHGGVDFDKYSPDAPRDLEGQAQGLWLTRDRENAQGFADYDWATGEPRPIPGKVHEFDVDGKFADSAELKAVVDSMSQNWRRQQPSAKNFQDAITKEMRKRGFDGSLLKGDELVVYNPDSLIRRGKK